MKTKLPSLAESPTQAGARPSPRARRAVGALVVRVALTAAPAARAGTIDLEAYGGWQHLRLSPGSVGNALEGDEGTGLLGVDLLGRIGSLGLGLSLDKTVSGQAQPWAGSIVAGFLIDLPLTLRIEALGEIGRRSRDLGDLFGAPGSTFLGLRPGLSFRLGPSPVRVGITGLARWPTSGGDIGSPDYGIVGRIGYEW
jgi:hypothetical protein